MTKPKSPKPTKRPKRSRPKQAKQPKRNPLNKKKERNDRSKRHKFWRFRFGGFVLLFWVLVLADDQHVNTIQPCSTLFFAATVHEYVSVMIYGFLAQEKIFSQTMARILYHLPFILIFILCAVV